MQIVLLTWTVPELLIYLFKMYIYCIFFIVFFMKTNENNDTYLFTVLFYEWLGNSSTFRGWTLAVCSFYNSNLLFRSFKIFQIIIAKICALTFALTFSQGAKVMKIWRFQNVVNQVVLLYFVWNKKLM